MVESVWIDSTRFSVSVGTDLPDDSVTSRSTSASRTRVRTEESARILSERSGVAAPMAGEVGINMQILGPSHVVYPPPPKIKKKINKI